MATVTPISRDANPFPTDGVVRDDTGAPRYEDLPSSLLARLAEWVDRRPDGEAVVELGGERLTYRQLWDRSARLAGGLVADGVAGGDRVAIALPAGVDWVLGFFGTLMAGAIPVALNTRWVRSETDFAISEAGARVVLSPEHPLPDGEPFVVDGLDRGDLAGFFFTSGTTGRPRAVTTTHEAFLTNARNMARIMAAAGATPTGDELRTLITVPLFHVTGCNSQLLVAINSGGTAVIMPELDIEAMFAAIATERISFMVTVPAIYALALRHPAAEGADVSAVRWVGYGGAPIAPSLVRALQQFFPSGAVFNGYGLTETASLLTCLPDSEAAEHADSVGYAMPSADLGIVPIGDDPNTGELVCRGGNVTAGYWNRPESTAATIVDGWLHTGDVVRVDDAGRIHIVDRVKDIINRGGENVSSIAVEDALLAAPGVADAAVIAVPDDVLGEKVGAVLQATEDGIDLDAVLAHCQEHLADYSVPQYVHISDGPLPRNAGGKLLKARLRDEIEWGEPLR